MPNDIFEQTAAQARLLIAVVRKEVAIPATLTDQRQVCVLRNGTCVTHGNAASTCAKDRA